MTTIKSFPGSRLLFSSHLLQGHPSQSKRWASRGGSEEERQRDEERKTVMSLE